MFISSVASGVESISGEVYDDLYFPGGVILENVKPPSDLSSATGSSTVDIAGTGTVTVGTVTGNGFPQMIIYGGTTITSSRNWVNNEFTKSWWEGQLSSPSTGRDPENENISFSVPGNHSSNSSYPIETYQFGLTNETFSFSTAAKVAFPAEEIDGTKIWLAQKQSEESWTIAESDYCIVENSLCIASISSANAVSLVKENLSSCPSVNIKNGNLSGPPSCILQCNRGYEPNDDWSSCVEKTSALEDLEAELAEIEEGGEITEGEDEFRTSALKDDNAFEWRQGYFRYRDTRNQAARKLDEDSLSGEELIRAQRLNRGYYSRSSKGGVESQQFVATDNTDNNKDNFLNYLLEIRNTFGENSSDNNFTASEEETSNEENQTVAVDATEKYRGSAPKLPSTGPGVFVGLAALGLGMMVFGARRK